MRRRHLYVGILLAALLTGALGQVLAAAMCPHMRRDHACCHARVTPDHVSHGIPGGMHITPASTTAVGADPLGTDRPVEGCEHCMGRSSQSPQTAAMREVERTNRGPDLAAPAAESRLSDSAPSFNAPVPAKEHGPPKASAERHILISVFRI
jgi:hypothetical protein